MPEMKTHRRLWRRQRLRVTIGVNFRQQLLQRVILNTLRRMKVRVAAMKMETKRMEKSHKKAKAKLTEMEAEYTELTHALESACTQVGSDTMVALLFAKAFCPGGSAPSPSP